MNKNVVNNNIKVPNFNRGDYNKLRESLSIINWKNIFKEKNMYEMWEAFKEIIEGLQRECIPVKTLRKSKNKPLWWNNEINEKIKIKRKYFKEYKSFKIKLDEEQYENLLKEVTKIIRKSKRLKEISVAKDRCSNPKKFYGYYKYNNKSKQSIGPLKDSQGNFTSSDNEIVDLLNAHFSSVFQEDNGRNNEITIKENNKFFNNIDISREEIKQLILKSDSNKSMGPDNIHIRVLKEGIDNFSEALAMLYSKSIVSGEIPDDWKEANVTALFKKGEKSDPENYRPISLTSVVSKLLEKLIKKSLVLYLENNNLLNESQHGYRNHRSCLTNLLEYVEHVTNEIDLGKKVDIIYIDFCKAFDKV